MFQDRVELATNFHLLGFFIDNKGIDSLDGRGLIANSLSIWTRLTPFDAEKKQTHMAQVYIEIHAARKR